MTTSTAIRKRLEALERCRRPTKELPRPWCGFSIPPSGPGEDDGYVDVRTAEEALAQGVPVFTFSVSTDTSDTQQTGDTSHG